MKKLVIPAITLFFIIIFILFILLTPKTKQITSTSEIEVIKEDSNLDILVNIGEFSNESYSESKLLDVAMQYATKLNLINETNIDDTYLQYINKNDLHNLIFELTGLSIEAPIEVEDFYYLYDSENEYYYYIGYSPAYYKISTINSVMRTKNNYLINCSIEKNEDGEKDVVDNVNISLTHKNENSIITYKIDTLTFN